MIGLEHYLTVAATLFVIGISPYLALRPYVAQS